MHTGLRLRLLPLTTPKIIAKTMIIAVLLPAGSHSAKQAMTQQRRLRISVFNLPIMSATRPAEKRPKKEPALRMETILKLKEELCPCDTAYVVIYVKGTKRPHSIRKIPSVTKVKGRSLKTVRSGDRTSMLATGFRGRRLRTRRLVRASRKTRMRPTMRVAHANPTKGKSL